MSDDLLGIVDESWAPTVEQIINHLTSTVCSLDEPWAGPDYHDDHGHTHCLFVGWAIKLLREGRARDERIIATAWDWVGAFYDDPMESLRLRAQRDRDAIIAAAEADQ